MYKKGFTLIELVMVIVIIGILAAVAIPKFVSLRNDANRAVCQSNIGAIRSAIATIYAQCNINATSTCPNGTACTNCFPNAAELDYNAGSPSNFSKSFFADGTVPDNQTCTAHLNWGNNAIYNVSTGSLNMTAACP